MYKTFAEDDFQAAAAAAQTTDPLRHVADELLQAQARCRWHAEASLLRSFRGNAPRGGVPATGACAA